MKKLTLSLDKFRTECHPNRLPLGKSVSNNSIDMTFVIYRPSADMRQCSDFIHIEVSWTSKDSRHSLVLRLALKRLRGEADEGEHGSPFPP